MLKPPQRAADGLERGDCPNKSANMGAHMAQKRAAKRFRRRMACELIADGRPQRAIVLDVSSTGMFVQTSTRLLPGTPVELQLRFEPNDEPMAIRARVVRHRSVPANLTSVAQGGIGLRILEAPPSFYEGLRTRDDDAANPRTTTGPGALQPLAPPAPAPSTPRFRVRVKQTDGPRSRMLDVAAETADAARTMALAQLGSGWEALGAEPV